VQAQERLHRVLDVVLIGDLKARTVSVTVRELAGEQGKAATERVQEGDGVGAIELPARLMGGAERSFDRGRDGCAQQCRAADIGDLDRRYGGLRQDIPLEDRHRADIECVCGRGVRLGDPVQQR
jgi:hypothetical protein